MQIRYKVFLIFLLTIFTLHLFCSEIWKRNFNNLVVVSPDVGGVVRARALAKRLDCDLAIIDKRRPKPNVASVMNIIGDIHDRTCIIMDDIIDTANTLCQGAKALKEAGAKEIYAFQLILSYLVQLLNESQILTSLK